MEDAHIRRLKEENELLKERLRILQDELTVCRGVPVGDILEKRTAVQEPEETCRQQNILIRSLQCMQTAKNIPDALNVMLGEIGEYTGVSRVNVFELSADGQCIINTYRWCNHDIKPIDAALQNAPVAPVQSWFDSFEHGEYICASDTACLHPSCVNVMNRHHVKSTLALPLTANGHPYGFVRLDECVQHREWRQQDIELLISLSQIIASSICRHHAEEALRKSEEMYRILTVASPNAIATCSPNGEITYMSPQTKALIGLNDNAQPPYRNIMHYVHPHDKIRALDMFNDFIRTDINYMPQLLLLREDGSEFFGEISAASIRDKQGEVTSVIFIIRDITDRRAQEMELILAKEKAEESDKLKSAFLANISHEIRTPINGILGFLRFLADDSLTPKRRQEYITLVSNNSKRLIRLIDNIMDVAKIESRQMKIHPVPVNLRYLMNDMYVFFDSQLQIEKRERLALIFKPDSNETTANIFVDSLRLWQIISNLIDNAIKFTQKGYVYFGYKRLDEELEFFVEDTGIGISQQLQPSIFDLFRQASVSDARMYEGAGLGLSLSRSLVRMMGGDISLESIEGVGSTFRFTITHLPVEKKDEYLFEKRRKTIAKPSTEKVVLVAQPDMLTFHYHECLLSSTGVTLIHAQTVRQWIEVINSRKHIDAVLADVEIFRNETQETIRHIKSIRSEMPLVLITSKYYKQFKQIINHIKYNKIITEPVDATLLIDALNEYL
ncbi:MAG: PAS domain S-box protein [Bacteroidales bacterium]|jgi:PAS domain S-box-containing protein|nr:PAS domain S-box protein [Bacteroidales bacterium]